MAEIAERCRAFDEDLSALIDGELGAQRRAEVLAHVAACSGCSARLAALRAVDGALTSLPAPAVAPDLHARLARRLVAERSADRARPPGLRSRRAARLLSLPAAAAAALALYLALRAPSPPAVPVEPEAVPVAKAPSAAPVEPEPATPPRIAERTPQPPAEGELESLGTEDLAVVLDLETIEDLPVIANLEVLERLLRAEAG